MERFTTRPATKDDLQKMGLGAFDPKDFLFVTNVVATYKDTNSAGQPPQETSGQPQGKD